MLLKRSLFSAQLNENVMINPWKLSSTATQQPTHIEFTLKCSI